MRREWKKRVQLLLPFSATTTSVSSSSVCQRRKKSHSPLSISIFLPFFLRRLSTHFLFFLPFFPRNPSIQFLPLLASQKTRISPFFFLSFCLHFSKNPEPSFFFLFSLQGLNWANTRGSCFPHFIENWYPLPSSYFIYFLQTLVTFSPTKNLNFKFIFNFLIYGFLVKSKFGS